MPAPYLVRPVQRYGSVPRGPLSSTLPQRIGQVPTGPLSQPVGIAGRPFGYATDPGSNVYGTPMIGGGYYTPAEPSFQYTPQEQAQMSRQRSFGQSSFGDIGLMPESYRRFAAGGQFGAPAQQAPAASMQNLPTGMRIGNAEVVDYGGRKLVRGIGSGAEPPLERRRIEVSTGPPPGGLSPEMEQRRQATIARQDQNRQMLGAGRNIRANQQYGTPLRPDLFPQAQQAYAGGQPGSAITDIDRRIVSRFADEDGNMDWPGAIGEYRQRGIDPATAAGKLEQGGLTIADIDEAISVETGWGINPDTEQIAYLNGLKEALQGRAKKGPSGAPARPATPSPSPASPTQPVPPQPGPLDNPLYPWNQIPEAGRIIGRGFDRLPSWLMPQNWGR